MRTFFLFCLCFSCLFAQDLNLDLMHPRYVDGVLMTDEGGVLCGEDLRVQARILRYAKKLDAPVPEFTLYASGDLIIDYHDTLLLGDYLEFDFITNEGCLYNGKTGFFPWFVGGERIKIQANGDLVIENGYLTTSEGDEKELLLRAEKIVLSCDKKLIASNLCLFIKENPAFTFPYFSLSLNEGFQSPVSVTAGIGGFLGAYVSLRYHALSLANWDFYIRADGYLNKGLGGGLETEYTSPFGNETLYTRSYYAHDISIDDSTKRDRYRFSGAYDFITEDEKSFASLIYDVLSDPEMANDFPPYDFDLGTGEKTELTLHSEDDFWKANLFTKVRVNTFQSLHQELPNFEMALHPFNLANTGLIGENVLRAGYHSYVFSKNVLDANPTISNFEAMRFEVHPRLYYPSNMGPFHITPEAGFIGIAYSNSPSGEAIGQALGDFNIRCDTELFRSYDYFKHVLQPYIHYHLYTQPRVSVDNYYIFSIQDGFNRLNVAKIGTKQAFLFSPDSIFTIDLWTNAFLETNNNLPQGIPKAYLDCEYQVNPFLTLFYDFGWNFAHKQVDYFNTGAKWSLTENCALSFDYLHRGRYDWRKADFYNFVLDVSRSEERLLASALSDKRDVVLGKIFYRFHHNWETEFEVRHGWNRETENDYFEYRLGLKRRLFDHFLLGFMYEKRYDDNRFAMTFKMAPSPPK